MAVIRYLFALLLGFLAGAGTTLWLVQSGTGDLLIRRTEVVQDLERRVREVEQQRDTLGRQLEDVLARSGRMEAAFNDLERRFRSLADSPDTPAPRAREQAVAPSEREAGGTPSPAN